MAQEQHLPHKLTLDERKKLTVTGVSEVVHFDEGTVELRTGLGMVLVQGQDLQLKQLSPDGGHVAVEGTVSMLSYEEPRRTGGWLRGIFR